MNLSMNGSPKEITAFLVALAGQYLTVRSIVPPVVTEVAGPEKPGNAGEIVGATGPVKSEGVQAPVIEPPPAPNGPVADTPAGDKPIETEKPTEAKKRKPRRPAIEYPGGWELMSPASRRNWAQTAEGLTAEDREKVVKENPDPETPKPQPELPKQETPKPETAAPAKEKPQEQPEQEPLKQETPKAETAPAHSDGSPVCALPPTWDAWSIPKRIMWATMRSVDETNALLRQFGFSEKIPDATSETLFNVRRKLEIAMRMEAQG